MHRDLITAKHLEVIETHRDNMINYLSKVNLSALNKKRFTEEIKKTTNWLNTFKIEQ